MEFEESRLKFKFSDRSLVVKFDDTKFYRNLFNSLPESKSVDFIVVDNDSISFIEVKNCNGDEGWRIAPNNHKRTAALSSIGIEGLNILDIEVPQKVAMMLSSLAVSGSFGKNKSSLDELNNIVRSTLETR